MTNILDKETLIDETLSKFVGRLVMKLVDGYKARSICLADEWIGYCEPTICAFHVIDLA